MTRSIKKYQKYLNGGYFFDETQTDTPTESTQVTETTETTETSFNPFEGIIKQIQNFAGTSTPNSVDTTTDSSITGFGSVVGPTSTFDEPTTETRTETETVTEQPSNRGRTNTIFAANGEVVSVPNNKGRNELLLANGQVVSVPNKNRRNEVVRVNEKVVVQPNGKRNNLAVLPNGQVVVQPNGKRNNFAVLPNGQVVVQPNGKRNNLAVLPNGQVVVQPNGKRNNVLVTEELVGYPSEKKDTLSGTGYRNSHYPRYISGSGYKGWGHTKSQIYGGGLEGVTEPSETDTRSNTLPVTETTTVTIESPEVTLSTSAEETEASASAPLPTFNSPLAHNIPPPNMSQAGKDLQNQLQQSIKVLEKMVSNTRNSIKSTEEALRGNHSASTTVVSEPPSPNKPLAAAGYGHKKYTHGSHPTSKHCGNSRYYSSHLSFDL